MITGPKYKICRRLGQHVYEKCQTPKYVASEARKGGKTKIGAKRPKALSDYAKQFLEKQRIRLSYGISERQFKNYVLAASTKKGVSAQDVFYQALEMRLDSVVYRLGLGNSRALARQLVSHGHITVNGKKITVPSAQVRVGDTISVREGSRKSPLFQNLNEKLKNYSHPSWLSFDREKLEAHVDALPVFDSTGAVMSLGTVFEFYSR